MLWENCRSEQFPHTPNLRAVDGRRRTRPRTVLKEPLLDGDRSFLQHLSPSRVSKALHKALHGGTGRASGDALDTALGSVLALAMARPSAALPAYPRRYQVQAPRARTQTRELTPFRLIVRTKGPLPWPPRVTETQCAEHKVHRSAPGAPRAAPHDVNRSVAGSHV